jgi:hypothetical protein
MPSARVLYDGIVAHIRKSGKPFSEWYAGITSDLEERLHGAHRVPKTNHWRSVREADSHRDARAVEAALHELGCQGAGGGGDHTAVFVYAYLITAITEE